MFGSCFTALAIPASDVDVVVTGLPSSYRSKLVGRGGALDNLARALGQTSWVSSVQVRFGNVRW